MDNLVTVLRGYLLTRSPASVLWALTLAILANKGEVRAAADINKLATRLAIRERGEELTNA